MERKINPLFNVFENYSKVNIINPHRFGGAFVNDESFDFNGSTGYIDFGNVLEKGRFDAFSSTFWVKRSATGATSLVSKSTTSNVGWRIKFDSSDRFYFELKGSSGTDNIIVRSNSSYTTLNVWNAYAFTYTGSGDASGVTLYRDGSSITTSIIENDLIFDPSTTVSLKIAHEAQNGQYGDVIMDEVAIFSSSVSSTDITTIHTSPSDLSVFSPELWVRADGDTTGANNVIDHSGNGYHGTINGGVTIVSDVP